MKTIIKTIITGILFSTWNFEFGSWISFANNVQVMDISVNQTTKIVSFSISWENSWRVTSGTNNWDAVWLFVKFKDCQLTSTDPYTHGILSTTLANHSFGSLQPMSTIITPGSVEVSSPLVGSLDDNTGVMLRRGTATTGTAPVTNTTIQLNVTNLLNATYTLSTKVFAIEMVYIPQGDFFVGDGDGSGQGSNGRFLGTNVNINALPMKITNAFETGTSTMYIYDQWWSGAARMIGPNDIPAAWPKGQCGFYMMKYEITENQYVGFLNSLASQAQANRYLGNYNSYRNQTQQSGITYVCGRPDRAQNFLSWADISAYLDWACLRPMTELEYEKACRGTGYSTYNEYAWGNKNITQAINFNTPGIENGTETIIGNASYGGASYTSGDAGQGPLRVGIFATATTNREQAGASYYGVMELSGNLREYVITLCKGGAQGVDGSGAANTFTRTYGDGAIDNSTGLHNVAGGWPTASNSATNPGGAWTNYVGNRGGSWVDGTTLLQVSDRNACWTPEIIRQYEVGGRGVR